MKKVFIIFMLLVASNTIGTKCFAQSAYGQLQQTAGYSSSAANSYSGGSYDYNDARSSSGCGFDKNCGNSNTVDLRDKGEHPTVQLFDRDAYVPQKYKSVKPSYVPPLR